ncbi:piezo-type mechanosensitive ion channel component-like isoform X2 [Adelges cooleyi]|uniref:piezo-type mechanosensitive ion channel component-like isoform X2 n=1 Tax=Adelges cooleyi TaxID=133065 RepID=UPI00217FDDD9|nr:piezo-type mechanosensitive ion channel component-like isoform X2 [Adelges cooleyi]
MVIAMTLDALAVVYVLLLSLFVVVSRRTVSKLWPYFTAFVYMVVTFKYFMYIMQSLLYHHDISWENASFVGSVLLKLYEYQRIASMIQLSVIDFVVLYFVSQQLKVFRHKNVDLDDQFVSSETYDSKNSDLQSKITHQLMELQQNVMYHYACFTIFVVFLDGIWHSDLLAIGYLYAAFVFYWKGPQFYLMPVPEILKFWRHLLCYNLSMILVKVTAKFIGCQIIQYFGWNPTFIYALISLGCQNKMAPYSSKAIITSINYFHDVELKWDVIIFGLLLLHRNVIGIENLTILVDETKASAVIALLIGDLVKGWESEAKDYNLIKAQKSLELTKIKLNKIRAIRDQYDDAYEWPGHSLACQNGQYMFEEISDDVHLVYPDNDYQTFSYESYSSKMPKNVVGKKIVLGVMYVVKKLNNYSLEYRMTMQALESGKKKLLIQFNSKIDHFGQHAGPMMEWIPLKSDDLDHTLVRSEFKDNWHENKHLLIQLIIALRDLINSRTHIICYLIGFVYMALNIYDIISVVFIAMMTLWGQLSVPRESTIFWIMAITYLQIQILLKHVCSFDYMPWMNEQAAVYSNMTSTENVLLYPTIKVGLATITNQVTIDVAALAVLLYHRRKLIKTGLWTHVDKSMKWYIKKPIAHEYEVLRSIRIMCVNIKTHLMPCYSFYDKLCNYETEGSVDVYPYMFMSVMFLMIYNLIVYHDAIKSIKMNKISKQIVLQIFLHMGMILLDRWFYVQRNKVGKLVFHVLVVSYFLYKVLTMYTLAEKGKFAVWAFIEYAYIMLSAYQIRSGYPFRYNESFIWHRHKIYNLYLFKIYYYCPFVYELRLVFDWIWTNSTLTMTEWFKMEDIYSHVCSVKCTNDLRQVLDHKRSHKLPIWLKLILGGVLVTVILIVIIFPITWFSLQTFEADKPTVIKMGVHFYDNCKIFEATSIRIQTLNTLDLNALKYVYRSYSKVMDFLDRYTDHEVSSTIIGLRSPTTWTVTPHTFNNLIRRLSDPNKQMYLYVDWWITHENGSTISSGNSLAPIAWNERLMLVECMNSSMINYVKTSEPVKNALDETSNTTCQGVRIQNALPKFVVTHMKSSNASIKPMFSLHDTEKPYMDAFLTFHHANDNHKYWWDVSEICPQEDETSHYLRQIPHSSCGRPNSKCSNAVQNFNCTSDYNIFIFSDRYSDVFGYFENQGIFGLYTVVIVYFGYKVMHDLFRSYKFKMSYADLPYTDRILQLCQEIYLVRAFGEWKMEEDLYAMLVFLFRSPETLIRMTRPPKPSDPLQNIT